MHKIIYIYIYIYTKFSLHFLCPLLANRESTRQRAREGGGQNLQNAQYFTKYNV